MLRQLLLIAVLIAGLWLIRRLRHRPAGKRGVRPYQEMVRCSHCGMHIPQSQAIGTPGEGYFCSQEHRLARQAAWNKDNP